jgi:hypothetical protein
MIAQVLRMKKEATTDDNIERVRDMALLDRRITIGEVANRLKIMKNCYYTFYVFIEIKGISLVRIIIASPTYFGSTCWCIVIDLENNTQL